ncbi:MAG: enoyl-CoA hydratase/isomerase family protein [Pseudomonadales bacterium]|nr:enoyl-CoA hydratase/isomerase family protein [Pseudomonadales bacterium]
MSNASIIVTRPSPGIACVTLNRPDRLNAIDEALLIELDLAVRAIARDKDVRVWILTGAARNDARPCFSAGLDLKAVAAGEYMQRELGPQVTDLIDDLLKPSIAMIDGIASTGAMELALACDFRIVGEQVQISDWHLKNLGHGLGAWGSPTRWLQLIGSQKTKEIILTGKIIDADEACRIGLALRRFSSASLWEKTLEFAESMAAMNPEGVAMALAHIQEFDSAARDNSLKLAPKIARWLGDKTPLAQRLKIKPDQD